LSIEEQNFKVALKRIASILPCGKSIPFKYESVALPIKGYLPGENNNVTYAMADHTAWFTWKGTVKNINDTKWNINGDMDRDIADYSDWHGDPYDYNGDGILECPGGYCGKTASFDLSWLPGFVMAPNQVFVPTITITDNWMARLVIGGKASNPGFGIYFNTRQSFRLSVYDW
jgi:hypothetical protein